MAINICSTCPHNMVNFGELAAEIDWRVWGTPANFNRFRVLVWSLLPRRRSTEINETLHDVCHLLGWHTIYIHIEDSCPLLEFCHVQIHFASKSCALLYWQRWCAALQQRASAKLCGVVQGMELSQRCHLYSAGRPSRWASAQIFSIFCFFKI